MKKIDIDQKIADLKILIKQRRKSNIKIQEDKPKQIARVQQIPKLQQDKDTIQYDQNSIYTSNWINPSKRILADVFSKCGKIIKISSFHSSAYIKFIDQNAMEAALKLNGRSINSKKIIVERKWKNKLKQRKIVGEKQKKDKNIQYNLKNKFGKSSPKDKSNNQLKKDKNIKQSQ